jgi:hypothetical protein
MRLVLLRTAYLSMLCIANAGVALSAPGGDASRSASRPAQYDFNNLGSQQDLRPLASTSLRGFVDKVSSVNSNLVGIDTDRAMAQRSRDSATNAADYSQTSSSSPGDSYACIVYCANGTTTITVRASSRNEAANIVDGQSDGVCRSDNRGNSTSRRLPPEQCSKR